MSTYASILAIVTPIFKKGRSPGWVAQLVGVTPTHQRNCGLILSQGTYLGCGFDCRSGHLQEATNQCLSLSLSCPLFKINEHILG